MLRFRQSGQFVYFTMISALSGNAVYSGGVGSLSGKISGYVCCDGGAQGGVAGFITEDGFGQYHLNAFDTDVSGRTLGFFFTTSSGVVPVSITATTIANISGQLSGQIVTPQSGMTYPASGSIFIASGSVVSGLIASGIVFIASGPNSVVPGVSLSGSLYLAIGSVFMNTFASGVVGGGSGNLPSAWGGSGAGTIGQNLDKSGYTDIPLSGQVFLGSGSLTSGMIASGTVFIASGPNVVLSSGTTYIASGTAYLATRTGTARSGTSTTIQLDAGAPAGTSGTFDGQTIALLGGTGVGQAREIQNYGSSGILTVFPAWATSPDNTSVFMILPQGAPLSGGTFITSGTAVNVNSGQLSGQGVTTLTNSDKSGYTAGTISGQTYLASGSPVVPYSGQLSGQFVTPQSGVTYPASGSAFLASGSVTSGLIASGTVFIASGPNVVASLAIASGSIYIASGTSVVPYSGQMSGQGVTTLTNSDKSGYSLTANFDKAGYGVGSGGINSGAFVSGMVDVALPDALLRRNFAFVSGYNSGDCNLIQGGRKLTNAWDTTTNSGYLTVFNESGGGVAYKQAITSASGSPPITALGQE
jgi:hypothetical protein